MHMNSRWFQNVTAAFILLIISGLCFQVLLSNPSDILVGMQNNGHNDTTSYFIAFKSYQNLCMETYSEFPFWNPYSLLGMPWLGNPQTSLFYPGNWIFFFVNALSAISWTFVLHHWWAGFGAYLLGRKYKLSFFSSLLSGIILLSAPYFIAKTGEGHFTAITQIAWFPWILYGYELLREGSKRAIPLLAVLISLAFFCGHVQELYYLLLFLTAAIAIESLIMIAQKKRAQSGDHIQNQAQPDTENTTASPRIWFKRWLITGVLTLVLVAVDLIPILIYTKQAVRANGINLDALRYESLNFSSLLQLLDPYVWGTPDQYTGPGIYYWEAICYFGCLPLLLAILGACSSIRNRFVVRLTLIGVAAFLLAFGPNLPFYTICYKMVPGFSMFRLPARLLWICSLVIAMLAGFGCESISSLLLQKKRMIYRRISGVCFAVVLLLMCYLMFNSNGHLTLTSGSNQILKLQSFNLLMAILGVSTAIFLASFSRKATIGGALILCLACSWELCSHSNQILRTVPLSSFREETIIIKFLKKNLGQQRVLVTQNLINDNEAWNHQILKVQGYEPVSLERFSLLAAAAFPQPDTTTVMAGFNTPKLKIANQPILDLMGIKYAILQTDTQIKLKGWRRIASGSIPEAFSLRGSQPYQIPYLIMENENPLPRAYIVGDARSLNPKESSKKIISAISKVRPRKEVLLQQDILPQGTRQSYKAAEIINETPGHLQIKAEVNEPGYLILSDIYCPGWSARVNNNPTPILPANYSLRAIPLPAGKNDIHLSFTPPGFKVGCLISIMTFTIILILLIAPFYQNSISAHSMRALMKPRHKTS